MHNRKEDGLFFLILINVLWLMKLMAGFAFLFSAAPHLSLAQLMIHKESPNPFFFFCLCCYPVWFSIFYLSFLKFMLLIPTQCFSFWRFSWILILSGKVLVLVWSTNFGEGDGHGKDTTNKWQCWLCFCFSSLQPHPCLIFRFPEATFHL